MPPVLAAYTIRLKSTLMLLDTPLNALARWAWFVLSIWHGNRKHLARGPQM
jgi:hypothetical protein